MNTFLCDLKPNQTIVFGDYPTRYVVESVRTEGAYSTLVYTSDAGRFTVTRSRFTTATVVS